MQGQRQTHVSEEKKQLVKDLAGDMKRKTVMVVSIKGLPSAQFQDIKKQLRGKAKIQVAKKSLIDFALEHSKEDHLKELVKYIDADRAILFSDEDAFEISGFLADNKISAKAKTGQEAQEDIIIEPGPTDLLPGPDISALSGVGLQVKVENGKLAIQARATLVKKGEAINADKASVLAKLGITPFKIGLEPIAALSEGKVYEDIKIDKEATLEELKDSFGRGLAFAVSLTYVTKETLTYILGKASVHESVISSLVKEKPEAKKEDETQDKSTEEEK